MCKADYLGSSIEDEHHLIKYVKDTVDEMCIRASNDIRTTRISVIEEYRHKGLVVTYVCLLYTSRCV